MSAMLGETIKRVCLYSCLASVGLLNKLFAVVISSAVSAELVFSL